jgi:hypothetical protein
MVGAALMEFWKLTERNSTNERYETGGLGKLEDA